MQGDAHRWVERATRLYNEAPGRFAAHSRIKLGAEFSSLPYAERLKALSPTNLEMRRIRTVLIQQYKLSAGLEHINWCTAQVAGPASAIGGNNKQLAVQASNLCQARYNF